MLTVAGGLFNPGFTAPADARGAEARRPIALGDCLIGCVTRWNHLVRGSCCMVDPPTPKSGLGDLRAQSHL